MGKLIPIRRETDAVLTWRLIAERAVYIAALSDEAADNAQYAEEQAAVYAAYVQARNNARLDLELDGMEVANG